MKIISMEAEVPWWPAEMHVHEYQIYCVLRLLQPMEDGWYRPHLTWFWWWSCRHGRQDESSDATGRHRRYGAKQQPFKTSILSPYFPGLKGMKHLTLQWHHHNWNNGFVSEVPVQQSSSGASSLYRSWSADCWCTALSHFLHHTTWWAWYPCRKAERYIEGKGSTDSAGRSAWWELQRAAPEGMKTENNWSSLNLLCICSVCK